MSSAKPVTFLNKGGINQDISDDEADLLFSQAIKQACAEVGNVSSVLLIPPDLTRIHSRAGFLTEIAFRELSRAGISLTVLPALGTHIPLDENDCKLMFPNIPLSLFRIHDWRNDVVELGRLEREWVENATGNTVSFDWPVQVNKLLSDGGFDLIISIGQVVPHEVAGMANHAKNLFVGTGGKEAIDKSHYAGAVYGMEKILGRSENPVRAMFDEGLRRFGNMLPPTLFALSVLSPREEKPGLALRGLFCGFGRDCFTEAASLASQVNIFLLDKPAEKILVYLDPQKYRSTWLGNKAIYRSRMAIASDGELLIIAPGLERFGEDIEIDALIRKYGYRPALNANKDLAENLCAAAHLIHGFSEGRFTVRYFPGPGLSRQEIEAVGFKWGDIKETENYNLDKAKDGWNTANNGERVFFISDPAMGLWANGELLIPPLDSNPINCII